jgi:hypothetical protein
MADARPTKMGDPRRYGVATEMHGAAALEVRHPSTAKMTHAAGAHAAAKMTHAATAEVNAAATAPTGELRLPGLRREQQ